MKMETKKILINKSNIYHVTCNIFPTNGICTSNSSFVFRIFFFEAQNFMKFYETNFKQKRLQISFEVLKLGREILFTFEFPLHNLIIPQLKYLKYF